jgi:hypothetical protein
MKTFDSCVKLVSRCAPVAFLLASTPALANIARNTSSANTMGEAGDVLVDTAGQLEGDADGKVWTVETALQYSLTDRAELVIEAIPFERQEVDSGETASGVGDTDVILSYLVTEQSGRRPALVFGAKVTVPTAGEGDLGTGKFDYSGLVVLSSELERTELNLELEFATFGSTSEEELKDQFIYSFGVDYAVTEYLDAYVELFGNTKPTDEESATNAAKFGLEQDIPVNELITPYVSAEIDTESLFTGRLGVEWEW